MTQGKALTDVAGRPMHVGDTVKQAGANGRPWWTPERGALWVNAGQTGTVVELGRTRAVVNFGRTKRGNWGTVDIDEPVLDRVQADMLLVAAAAGLSHAAGNTRTAGTACPPPRSPR